METLESLKIELEFYKKKFSLGESDVALDGYLTYVNLVRQQVEFLKDFKIKSTIDGKKADTVLYERAMDMGEKLPKMISSMNALKLELNVQYDENEGKVKRGATTPQSAYLKN